jgi:hypothetical protein
MTTLVIVWFLYWISHNVGGSMTLQDLRDALKHHPKADTAIFWWAFMWTSGRDSDIYKILTTVPYDPPVGYDVSKDPEAAPLIQKLDDMFGPMVEHPLQPVKYADVYEGDILIAGEHFLCLLKRWPCRVYRKGGTIGVACGGGVNHIGKPGEHFWHPLQEDDKGFVIGFRR